MDNSSLIEDSNNNKFDLVKIVELLETDWKDIILNDENISILENINEFLNDEQEKFEGLQRIFPKQCDIFNAFKYFNISDLKIVLIGQDCYHAYQHKSTHDY